MSKIKICGLSRIQDIEAVNRTLPDFIGFVFAPGRRRVDIALAAMLKEKLNSQIETVGVFVNEKIETITEIYRKGIINLVQLHGDEDDEYIKQLKKSCAVLVHSTAGSFAGGTYSEASSTCRVIKAVGVGDVLPSLPVESDYVLFDTLSEHRGGTGKSFDWRILKEYCTASLYHGLPFFLAGGLSIENTAEAIQMLNPFCIDVSSGVETDGLKDTEKIEKIVSMIRGIYEQ
ncbi:MAG: phosphoribosylanthranilate isomerase [Treponema sp.]|jgi:phosphoribosylanthranilate isomerase|nr:phosphoribosylanthranilate isomerase [Treponema sp.]